MKRSYLINSIFIIFGLSLGLIGVEVSLRILNHNSGTSFESVEDLQRAMLTGDDELSTDKNVSLRALVQPNNNEKIIYDLKPNLKVKFQNVLVETNSLGIKGKELSNPKDENTFRIALLGDSFAFGWGVEENESFAAVLEDFLNSKSKDVKFEVINLGIPGYSTFQETERMKELYECVDPDVVLLFFVENDFALPFFVRNVASDNSTGIFSSVEFSRLAWRATNPEVEEEKLRLQGLDPNTSLKDLANFLSEKGVPLFVTINPKKNWRRYYKKLWVLKKSPLINFLKLRDEYIGLVRGRKINEKDLTLSTDPHPSPLRHKIYGEIMAPHFYEFF